MAAKRSYFSSTGPQLQSLFESNRQNAKVLRDLLAELRHRSTPTAHALRREVEEALAQATAGASTASPKRPPPPVLSLPQRRASPHTLACRSCNTSLRVPVRAERAAYTCPTCRAEFETAMTDDVLQVLWAAPQSSNEDQPNAMNDALAREVLGVDAHADFAAIKAAWREASQQCRPNMHQALPERLRKAAESELRRINEAFHFLEGSTASEF